MSMLRTLVLKLSVAKRIKFGMDFQNCPLTNFCQCGNNSSGRYPSELLFFFFSHHVDEKNDSLAVKDPTSNVDYGAIGAMSHRFSHNVSDTHHVSPVL